MEAGTLKGVSPGLDPERFAVEKAAAAREALARTALLTTDQKNEALALISDELGASADIILEANGRDMAAGEKAGLGARLDRLLLTRERIEGIRRDIANVITLPDPVGEELGHVVRPNGMRVSRVRTPLGVVGIIYESRPNVTVDASVLCLKTGNAVVLKGGSEALHSNRAIVETLRRALGRSAVPAGALQLLDSSDRAVTQAFLRLRGYLDVV
ncbi:MAG: aldehyde dehydrogenase family protein, partial [Deltaproteobacteria bacterium]|nr:aldehyde dehydrogenase family protein [Deltaproteobacteria bacterium]